MIKDRTVFVIIAVCLLLYATYKLNQQSSKKLRWLSCEDTFDSVLVVKRQNRGAFEGVLDSLILSSGYKSLDPSFCMLLPNGDLCSLSSVKVPFIIYKPKSNDTLQVIKEGKVIFFKIPCDANTSSGW